MFFFLSSLAMAQEIRAPHVVLGNSFFEKLNPNAAEWNQISEQIIQMLPQNITTPSIFKTTVSQLKVKALHNNKWVAARLEWEDKTRDANVSLDHASDACAIQFPLKEMDKTSPFMGGKDFPVEIIHWKAIWQQDIEDHYQTVKDLYPNTYFETYQFGIQAATQVKNPISEPARKTPVEELVAAGFGTLTHQSVEDSFAWGSWENGKWTVVLAHKMTTRDPNDPVLKAGKNSLIAFAIWEGSSKNVGARKNYAPWIPLVLEAKK
ncbi:MAG: hypothetical protein A2W61_06615 [Deltaproteobacteria bacterium RIFCSPLOWO2_01_44_7]|nr:MAG: hypothetical protein A2712_01220 [Deltaproteobacteria bacterium RIFCSPHIGHO2_01_FULL_43_49]OGQ15244.1 MAG: hypothetical protein A3D22_04255 [Deltaproteobacteria bacterium RIFCSPHIGHO2_02_FULL_44_53]OGQ27133.1 MAG: hypothetical protein A3D98_01810 [Deltaproteobacteria bacterium RIFCSPHIGHO2_12_FULL_44_21]OGQ31760.1 MAG: hypothetical protein A2979_05415 [Deltaproteobacteria bacterium RIFCSPLOWO2_01_FULL_45_74]OGQ42149.1 MAG: hypothetical protein A2W61_06615 [Deltaproteobacteria bacterium 